MSSTRTPQETVGRMPITSQSSTRVTSGALRGTSTVTVRSGYGSDPGTATQIRYQSAAGASEAKYFEQVRRQPSPSGTSSELYTPGWLPVGAVSLPTDASSWPPATISARKRSCWVGVP